jgi:predicted esterase
MSKVNKIKAAIKGLGEEEYNQLRRWFSERDWEKWDRQIESDSESGKLDFLLNEALDEKAKGKLKDL